jgi:alkyl hydroperoxide reductase subunit F
MRASSFTISPVANAHDRVRFAGLPMGHEFTSLVLALLWAGGHPPKVSQEVLDQVTSLTSTHNFEMYFSLTCHNCPDVVQALTLIALKNPRFSATLIEGGTYQAEVDERGVMAVPAVFKDGKMWLSGKKTLEEIVADLDEGAEAKAARPSAPRSLSKCWSWAVALLALRRRSIRRARVSARA